MLLLLSFLKDGGLSFWISRSSFLGFSYRSKFLKNAPYIFSFLTTLDPTKPVNLHSKITFTSVNDYIPWDPRFGKSKCKKQVKIILTSFAFCLHILLMAEWAQYKCHLIRYGAWIYMCACWGGILKPRIDQRAQKYRMQGK